MFNITKLNLLLIDPILLAELKLRVEKFKQVICNISNDFSIMVEENNHKVYVYADNGVEHTDKIECSNITGNKLLSLR